ncbi:MAG TPA: hemerythrin domain-containing protein [Clostridiales bacterium]|jgi:hemerythrin-like domain-containing protein|nr:hemerythrin domain-containing protein [Clostridiales bacterium]
MDSIALMVEDHKNIKRMLKVIRKYCYRILKGMEIEYEDFYRIIDFIKNYADAHHHGKEEKMLFNRMVDELGPAAEKLVTHGMLVEHDLGRLYTMQLGDAVAKVMAGDDEAKLDIIGNAIGYADLLSRHIDKEDRVVYEFARRNLAGETLEEINMQCNTFEEKASASKIQQKYINLLDELEAKYTS